MNLPLTSNIYLVVLKKAQTDKSKPHDFLLCLKRNAPQTFKSSSCGNPFLQCICSWYELL